MFPNSSNIFGNNSNTTPERNIFGISNQVTSTTPPTGQGLFSTPSFKPKSQEFVCGVVPPSKKNEDNVNNVNGRKNDIERTDKSEDRKEEKNLKEATDAKNDRLPNITLSNCTNCTFSITINQKESESKLVNPNIKKEVNKIAKRLDEIDFKEGEDNSEEESETESEEEEDEEEDYKEESNPNAPICTRSDYVLHPQLYDLQHMKTSELKKVKNFYVEKIGIAKVYYLKPVDLRNVDIDVIDIGLDEEGESYVEIKHRISMRSKRSDLLKVGVILTFENVKMNNSDLKSHENKLKMDINAKCITYNKQKKTISFELPHL